MRILLFVSCISFINVISASYEPTSCILPPCKYGPAYIQADNAELKKWRTLLAKTISHKEAQEVSELNKNITCLEVVPKDLSEYRRCFQYAIETITGFNGSIDLPQKNHLSIKLEKYVQQTPCPKFNDLIIYTTSAKDLTVHHFAVAIDQIWFKSKSGSDRHVYEHLPFDLDEYYGNAVWSFELKPEYQGDAGRKLLVQDIQLDMHNEIRNLIQHNNFQFQNNQKNKQQFFLIGLIAGCVYCTCLAYLSKSKDNISRTC